MITLQVITRLYSLHKPKLVNFGINRLKVSRQEADDLVQEVFFKLLEKGKKGVLPNPITYSLLRTMLKNIFIDQRRKYQREQKTLESYSQVTEQRAGHYTEVNMEQFHSLIQKGNFFSKTEVKIWQIYCQQNYDRQKTAQYLNQSLNYIDQYLHLIRKKIKEHIEQSTVIRSYQNLYEQ